MDTSFQYVIQITPEAPPMVGGVASYVSHIESALNMCGIDNAIVAFKASDIKSHIYYCNNDFNRLSDCVEQIRSLNGPDKKVLILLHYVGYGYDKNGLPWALGKIIDKLHLDVEVRTIFHEIGSDGPIWTKAFWTASLQKRLARSLALSSHRIITTTKWYESILKKWTKDSTVLKHIPVFSNMGEPESRVSIYSRVPRMIIFGGRELKRQLYQHYTGDILKLKEQYQLEEIIDIGPAVDEDFYKATGIKSLGVCDEIIVGQYLSSAYIGVMQYDPRTLDKSGVYAAYQAHGLPMVVFYPKYTELLNGISIPFDNSGGLSKDQLEKFSEDVFQQYKSRSINNLVQFILEEK